MWVYLQLIVTDILLQEEAKEETSALSVHGHNIQVTEVLKDGDTLTFLIVSQKVRTGLFRCYFLQHFTTFDPD